MEPAPVLIPPTPPVNGNGGGGPTTVLPNAVVQLEIVTQRNASRALVSKLLDIGTSAFSTDDAFGWRYPKRAQYPDYNRAMFGKFLSTDLLNPNVWVVVAYLDENGARVPVGYGTWERKGSVGRDEVERDNWLQKSERCLHSLQIKISEFMFPNPAANKPAIALMKASFQDTEERLECLPLFTTNGQYHLNFLAVDPSYQRRGIGGAIVDWGINKARIGGLPCSLVASRAGKKVYMKSGFQEIGLCDPFHGEEWKEGMHCKEQGCDFAVGSFMIWDPNGHSHAINLK